MQVVTLIAGPLVRQICGLCDMIMLIELSMPVRVVHTALRYDWPIRLDLFVLILSSLCKLLLRRNSWSIFSSTRWSSSLMTHTNLANSFWFNMLVKLAFRTSMIISAEWPPEPKRIITFAIMWIRVASTNFDTCSNTIWCKLALRKRLSVALLATTSSRGDFIGSRGKIGWTKQARGGETQSYYASGDQKTSHTRKISNGWTGCILPGTRLRWRRRGWRNLAISYQAWRRGSYGL